MVDWRMDDGYDWAYKFDRNIKSTILKEDFEKIVNYNDLEFSELAIPTPDHFYPLLNILGAVSKEEDLKIFNNVCELGSMSMTSYIFEK